MKRKNITLLCIVLCLIILQINVRLSNAKDGVNLFDEILIQTKSKTVEYGLKATFKNHENPKEVCNNLIDELELNNSEIKLNIVENDNSYCIDFLGENIKGYIESLKYNNEEVVTINISKIGSENGLQSLKNKVSNCIGYRDGNIKYFQYLKAKIPYSATNSGVEDINAVNEKILKILKSHGTENIETVKINNGLSTVAYTKRYDEKLNNNKLTDFNYAVCNYSSGNYIIIGTPEIIITY
ncbi:YwmB family TATA-box binding protein [Clostridium bowmanii]|uniref:YwmB family TATA-box binding protein n=1 Tax=Clostridium bowmanii TaxID=132925 RepID=UPI001C0B1A5E|nr:YwmB family TATA-box binding protein [Clostridium bowmanii]MBU3188999.1 YwmB family TATA-box binding protein [Clostridium bowmanii]MCA1073899.1 YwmB family TATA-box binding protein [Clostridium bowmanii]